MTRDPNWLYSAIAQSSAALIAISGGFIASRLIRMGQERSELVRRHRRTSLEYEACREDADNLEARLLMAEGKELAKDAVEDVVDSLGRATAEEIVSEYSDYLKRWRLEELAPFIRPLVAAAKLSDQAFDEYYSSKTWIRTPHYTMSGPPPPEIEDVLPPSALAELTDIQQTVSKGVIKKRWRDSPAGKSLIEGLVTPSVPLSTLIPTPHHTDRNVDAFNRLNSLRPREDEMKRALELQQHEIDQLDKPSNLRSVILAFSIFLMLGVVSPLVLMAIEPVPSSWWVRGLSIMMFVLGILIVGMSLVSKTTKEHVSD